MKRSFKKLILSLGVLLNTNLFAIVIGLNANLPKLIKPSMTDKVANDLGVWEINASLDVVPLESGAVLQEPTPSPTPVVVPTLKPVVATKQESLPSSYDPLFETYGQAFNVNPEILKIIAKCESNFNPGANSGPYGGMYQYLASTWSSTRNTMGLDPNPELRFDAEEAIKTTAWKISVGGIGAWPHCSQKALSQVG